MWLWLGLCRLCHRIQTYQVLQEHLATSTFYSCLRPAKSVQTQSGKRKKFPPLFFVFFLSPCFAELTLSCIYIHLKWNKAALLPDPGLSYAGVSIPYEGELALCAASSDNNDDSRGLNCTVLSGQGMKRACYNMDSGFKRANKQVSSITASADKRDGILVGSQ